MEMTGHPPSLWFRRSGSGTCGINPFMFWLQHKARLPRAARSHNAPLYASAGFASLAPRLYEAAGVKPTDIDTVQIYENLPAGF